jgi:hypothetical protein
LSNKLIFRGARVRYFDVRDSKAGVSTLIYVTTDFSDPIREAMGWKEPGVISGKMGGELNATRFILTPNQKELRQHELQMGAVTVDDFQYFEVKDRGNETTSEELRFIITTADNGAAGLVEQYMRTVGTSEKSIGQLRINYEVQMKLEDKGDGADDEKEEAGPCVDCNNGVPMLDGDPTMHASGQPCSAYEGDTGGPALASAVLMGGSHQRGKKRGGRGKVIDVVPEQVN